MWVQSHRDRWIHHILHKMALDHTASCFLAGGGVYVFFLLWQNNLRTMRASTGDELWRNRLFLLILSRTDSGQTWWLTPSILAFGRQKQMDFCEFRFSLVYDVSSQSASAMHWDSVLKNNNTIKMGWGCTQFNICLTAFPKALSQVPSTGGKKQTKF